MTTGSLVEVTSNPLLSMEVPPESFRSHRIFQGKYSEARNEIHQIVTDPELNKYVQNVFQRMLDAVTKHPDFPHGVDLSDASIHVADAKGYAYTFLNPNPEIVVDAHLIEILDTEDSLAFTIGHEIAHSIYQKIHHLSPSTRVSIVEEAFCDKLGLELSILAGYSPKGAPELFQKLLEERSPDGRSQYTNWVEKSLKVLTDLFDAHLDLKTRYSNVQIDFPGIDRLLKGGVFSREEIKMTPIRKDLLVNVQSQPYKSYFQKKIEAERYDSLDVAGKVQFLEQQFPAGLQNQARADEYTKMWKALASETMPLGQREHIEQSIHRIFSSPLNLSKEKNDTVDPLSLYAGIYSSASKIILTMRGETSFGEGHLPMGQFRKFENDVNAFNQAHSFRSGFEAAQRFLQDYPVLKTLEKKGVTLQLPAAIQGSPSPNDPRVQWAQADESGTILKYLIIRDFSQNQQALCELMPLEFIERINREDYSFFERGVVNHIRRFAIRADSSISVADIWIDHEKFLVRNEELLRMPPTAEVVTADHPYAALSLDERWKKHNDFIRDLTDELSNALHTKSPEKIAIVRKLLLDPDNRDSLAGTFNAREGGFEFIKSNTKALPKDNPLLPRVANGAWASFLREHAHFFSLSERLYLHVSFPYMESSVHAVTEQLAIEHPGTLEGFCKLFSEAVPLPPTNSYSKEGEPPLKPGWIFGDHPSVFLLPSNMLTEILAGNDPAFGSEKPLATLARSVYLIEDLLEAKISDEVKTQIRTAIARPEFQNALLAVADFEYTPQEAAEILRFMSEFGLFADQKQRDSWSIKVLIDVRQISDPKERLVNIEKLFPLTNKHTEVGFKNTLIEEWTDTIVEIHGEDLGDPYYRSTMLEAVQRISKGQGYTEMITHDLKRQLAMALAEKTVSQPALAYTLEAQVTLQPQDMPNYNILVKGLEALLADVENSPERIETILTFLTSDGSDAAAAALHKEIKSWGFSDTGNWLQKQVGSFLDDPTRDNQTPILLQDLHQHFWDLDINIRIAGIKQLLIPPAQYYTQPEETFKKATEYVLDGLFRQESALTPQQAKEAEWGKELLTTFLEVSHESEWGFILAAIASATRAAETGEATSTGKKIKIVLEALGPAYIKLGQAIHSYPNTPKEIREELESLMGQAAPLPRWDLLKHMHKTLSEKDWKSIVHFGKSAGSASFNLTMECEVKIGDRKLKTTYERDQSIKVEREQHRLRHQVVAALREHSLARALKGFSTLGSVAERMFTKNVDLRPYKSDALRIIGNAKDMSLSETDNRIGHKQFLEARKQYRGLTVQIKGFEMSFYAVPWNSFKKEYRFMDFADGLHFNEIPDSQRYSEAKQALAQSILMVELQNILRGTFFDCDRHKRQYKILFSEDFRKMRIGCFDHGGMSHEKPTEEEKRQFADLLLLIGEKARDNQPIKDILYSELNTAAQSSDYFTRVQKALLALSFVFEHIPQDSLLDTLRPVLAYGEVDPSIKSQIMKNIPEVDRKAKLFMRFRFLLRGYIKNETGSAIFRKRFSSPPKPLEHNEIVEFKSRVEANA